MGFCATLYQLNPLLWHGYWSGYLTSHLVPQVLNGTQIWWKCRPGNDLNAICLEIIHADARRVRTCIVLLKWRRVGMSVFRYVINVTTLLCERHWNMFFLLCLYRQSNHSPICGPTIFNKWELTTWRHLTDHTITHHWSVKCSQSLVK